MLKDHESRALTHMVAESPKPKQLWRMTRSVYYFISTLRLRNLVTKLFLPLQHRDTMALAAHLAGMSRRVQPRKNIIYELEARRKFVLS